MTIGTTKAELISYSLANANMLLKNAIASTDTYIEEKYGSEKELFDLINNYINLAIKIDKEVPDLGEDANVTIKTKT